MVKKILIFIIAYKASFRLRDVFNEIPHKKLKEYNISFLISDDSSKDDTIDFAKKIKNQNKDKRIYLNENKKNIGYGANIKKCLKFSLKKNYDYAVMIHGDGQYSPKYIPNLLKRLVKNPGISACTGSRVFNGPKSALRGGMPFYKLIGNIFLTKIFNILLKKKYTDTHTGLWAYNMFNLKDKKFIRLTNSFNFDQEFRFLKNKKKKEIDEIAIRTKYGDERSQLHINYAVSFLLRSLIFFLIKNKIINSSKYK